MRNIIALFAGVVALICGAGTAWAASPVYCALYAKEFIKQAAVESQGVVPLTLIRDRAYHQCLNMDDEPLLPTAYVDPGNGGSGVPFAIVEGTYEPGADAGSGDTAAVEADMAPAKVVAQAGPPGGSGFAVGSPEWRKWCSSHFPNSFDPESGTVVPRKTGERTACR